MNHPAVSLETAGAELNRLHREIEGKLRSTVGDAIRAGEILSQVKERLKHGDFLPWIQANCKFSQKTAYRYLSLHDYRNKIVTVTNLQEAYQQIESLEAVERRKEAERKAQLINERIRTGQKPEGWDRSLEYEYQKRIDDDAYHARAEAAFEAKRAENSKPEPESQDTMTSEQALGILKIHAEAVAQRQDWKEKIRVSHEGKASPFLDAIIDYMETLPDDNRRLEACFNIIKVCKRLAVELQGSEKTREVPA